MVWMHEYRLQIWLIRCFLGCVNTASVGCDSIGHDILGRSQGRWSGRSSGRSPWCWLGIRFNRRLYEHPEDRLKHLSHFWILSHLRILVLKRRAPYVLLAITASYVRIRKGEGNTEDGGEEEKSRGQHQPLELCPIPPLFPLPR